MSKLRVNLPEDPYGSPYFPERDLITQLEEVTRERDNLREEIKIYESMNGNLSEEAEELSTHLTIAGESNLKLQEEIQRLEAERERLKDLLSREPRGFKDLHEMTEGLVRKNLRLEKELAEVKKGVKDTLLDLLDEL